MRYWIDKDELPTFIQADTLEEAVEKARELLGVVPENVCDNTDCPHGEDGVKESIRIKLKEEFISEGENGICEWCWDCIKRDEEMIEKVGV